MNIKMNFELIAYVFSVDAVTISWTAIYSIKTSNTKTKNN